MVIYVGLDVSDKTTHICVVDGEGAVLHAPRPHRVHRFISTRRMPVSGQPEPAPAALQN